MDSAEPLGKQRLSGSAAASETKKDVATPLTMNSLLDTGIVKVFCSILEPLRWLYCLIHFFHWLLQEPKGKSAVWSNYK